MTGSDTRDRVDRGRRRACADSRPGDATFHDSGTIPHTPDRERKRMVRLLMEDVTLVKTAEGLTTHLRFRGGATTTLTLARALNAWQLRETSTEIVALVDQLLDQHTDGDHRDHAERTGLSLRHRTAVPQPHRANISAGATISALDTTRLRGRGMLTPDEIADRLNVSGRHRQNLGAPRSPAAAHLQRQTRMPLRASWSECPRQNARPTTFGSTIPNLLPDHTNAVQYEA